MSIAEATREAVRERPFLLDALRAGVVNYRAAAATLDLDASDETVAAALRRFADDLPDRDPESRDARVTVERGVGVGDGADGDALATVGDRAVVPDAGSATALVATGDVNARALTAILGRLDAAGVEVTAAAVGGACLVVVVDGRAGGRALRVVEAALDAVPA
ncbi:DUF7523 family protein [Haloplanus halophilus]|uniref:DUF7523 family protein n=1 Tax=Haloplanus halophilus TaxID=2949993 RepID=UPI00203E6330|nr:hypothetical protein [Haloplanus sp. GDY1]